MQEVEEQKETQKWQVEKKKGHWWWDEEREGWGGKVIGCYAIRKGRDTAGKQGVNRLKGAICRGWPPVELIPQTNRGHRNTRVTTNCC